MATVCIFYLDENDPEQFEVYPNLQAAQKEAWRSLVGPWKAEPIILDGLTESDIEWIEEPHVNRDGKYIEGVRHILTLKHGRYNVRIAGYCLEKEVKE